MHQQQQPLHQQNLFTGKRIFSFCLFFCSVLILVSQFYLYYRFYEFNYKEYFRNISSSMENKTSNTVHSGEYALVDFVDDVVKVEHRLMVEGRRFDNNTGDI